MIQSVAIPAVMCADDYDMICKEIHRSAAEASDRMDDRTKVICRSRDMLRGKRLAALKASVFGRRGPLKRLKNAINNVWCMFWAITFGGVWVEMGENLGLWEYVGDEEEKKY